MIYKVYVVKCTGCNNTLKVEIMKDDRIIVNGKQEVSVVCPCCRSDYYLDIIKEIKE